MERSSIADNLRDLLNLPQMLRIFAALIRDPRVSVWLKIGVAAGALYVVSPLDILPDAIFGIGWVDDILLGFLVLQSFIKMAPAEIVDEHCARLGISFDDIDIDLKGTIRSSVTLLAPLMGMSTHRRDSRSSHGGAAQGTTPSNGERQPPRPFIPAGNPKYSAYKESQD